MFTVSLEGGNRARANQNLFPKGDVLREFAMTPGGAWALLSADVEQNRQNRLYAARVPR